MRRGHIAKARPDLFYAYVGSGQAVNQGLFKAVAYWQLLAEARGRNDRKAIGELEGERSTTVRHRREGKCAHEVGKRVRGRPTVDHPARVNRLVRLRSRRRGSTRLCRGIVTSQDHFREAVDREDLRALGTRFDVPFFISQGAQDNVTPVVPVRDYFETIRSPEKEMVVIPGGGHNVATTMSGEFLKLPVDRVKPLSGSCPSIQDRQSRRRWRRTVTSRCRCATRVKPPTALRHD